MSMVEVMEEMNMDSNNKVRVVRAFRLKRKDKISRK